MQESFIIIILCAISGWLAGISIAIGFWPIKKQPKNIRLQILLAIVSLIILLIIFYLKFILPT